MCSIIDTFFDSGDNKLVIDDFIYLVTMVATTTNNVEYILYFYFIA